MAWQVSGLLPARMPDFAGCWLRHTDFQQVGPAQCTVSWGALKEMHALLFWCMCFVFRAGTVVSGTNSPNACMQRWKGACTAACSRTHHGRLRESSPLLQLHLLLLHCQLHTQVLRVCSHLSEGPGLHSWVHGGTSAAGLTRTCRLRPQRQHSSCSHGQQACCCILALGSIIFALLVRSLQCARQPAAACELQQQCTCAHHCYSRCGPAKQLPPSSTLY